MASICARLEKIKCDPSGIIDAAVVRKACEDCGHEWRERKLGPRRTLEVFAIQIARGNTAISHAARLFGGEFTEAAYCRARSRVPVSVLEALLKWSASTPVAPSDRALAWPFESSHRVWRGHRPVLTDGTGISAPDTPELRGQFGACVNCAPGSGLPMVKTLLAFDARIGTVLDVHVGKAMSGDLRYVNELHDALRPGDVLVGDRGFTSYKHLCDLVEIGCDGVFRLGGNRQIPFPAAAARSAASPGAGRHREQKAVLLRRISDDDQIVEIERPRNRPAHIPKEEWEKLPEKLDARVLRYSLGTAGVRTRHITLITTLTDASKYPAGALAELYRVRWQVELNIRHLKRTMGMDRLKCQSVDGVKREMLMFCLVYNAVCRVRAAHAAERGLAPARLSFIDTLRLVQETSAGPPKPGSCGPPIKQCPKRPPRMEPRWLKRRHSDYRVMTLPRSDLRKIVEAKVAKA